MEIAKPSGGKRLVAVPTATDRVVERAIIEVVDERSNGSGTVVPDERITNLVSLLVDRSRRGASGAANCQRKRASSRFPGCRPSGAMCREFGQPRRSGRGCVRSMCAQRSVTVISAAWCSWKETAGQERQRGHLRGASRREVTGYPGAPSRRECGLQCRTRRARCSACDEGPRESWLRSVRTSRSSSRSPRGGRSRIQPPGAGVIAWPRARRTGWWSG